MLPTACPSPDSPSPAACVQCGKSLQGTRSGQPQIAQWPAMQQQQDEHLVNVSETSWWAGSSARCRQLTQPAAAQGPPPAGAAGLLPLLELMLMLLESQTFWLEMPCQQEAAAADPALPPCSTARQRPVQSPPCVLSRVKACRCCATVAPHACRTIGRVTGDARRARRTAGSTRTGASS